MQFALVTMRRMPDFLATRETRSFDDAPVVISLSGWYPGHTDLHLAGTFTQQITYRNGQEAVDDPPPDERSKQKAPLSPTGLASSGEFGPILAVALTDALKGKLSWGYWEVTENGAAAVFHFQVSRQDSHYAIRYCCFFVNRKLQAFTGKPAYHGSLSIDPVTGTVLRIVMQSDFVPSDPISEAVISVRYGDVEIGGGSYVCPVRSVAISLIRLPTDSTVGRRSIRRVNESTFLHYRRFGSTVRIVPDLPKQ
jgi:hypothetical protein